MNRRPFLAFILAFSFCALPLEASSRAIVRLNAGAQVLSTVCGLLGCTVGPNLGDPIGQVFLVTSDVLDVSTLVGRLLAVPGVTSCEPDLLAHSASTAYAAPSALSDTAPVQYYGTTVPHGYVNQPATAIVGLPYVQEAFKSTGAGIVAIIDTGVDPNHPALAGVLLPGYDFTRNRPGADETADASSSESPSDAQPNEVRSMGSADVSQSTAAVVDGPPGSEDFGHGTMVAGIIHLVAPTSWILPLKAFSSNGTGYTSDILRAIYAAVNENAQVINMSFNLAAYSPEMKIAIEYATLRRVICVAAAGNGGQQTLVYPAALTNLVMGVASTTNDDVRSSFSNYGPNLVWVAAPGEGVVTTYPYGLYAAGWGTSFSTPFVSGTAALLVQMGWISDENSASGALAHAVSLGSDLGHGRLDIYQAGQAWRAELGIH